MKKLSILASMVTALVAFTACSTDRDDNPTLSIPATDASFVLYAPGITNNVINLDNSTDIVFKADQPNYGYTASIRYMMEFAASQDGSTWSSWQTTETSNENPLAITIPRSEIAGAVTSGLVELGRDEAEFPLEAKVKARVRAFLAGLEETTSIYSKELTFIDPETSRYADELRKDSRFGSYPIGKIGDVVSIDATCTSLHEIQRENLKYAWNSICYWGPTALLPVFQLLGTDYVDVKLISKLLDKDSRYDQFTRINLIYPNGTATVSVGRGVKSEGELVISGTKGYIYVPSPWWKTDYFEIRYENPADNKRYFFQLEGEGIRQELVAFLKAIDAGRSASFISDDVASCISDIMDLFHRKENLVTI